MIKSSLRRLASLLLFILPELYSLIECVVGLLVLTFILRWLDLADGVFARVVSTIWLLVAVSRSLVRRKSSNKRRRDEKFVEYGYVLEHYAQSLASVSVVPENPADLEPAAIRHERAIIGVMTKTGMSRDEVMNALKRYSI